MLCLPFIFLVQMCQTDGAADPEIMDKLDVRLQSLVKDSDDRSGELSSISRNSDGDPLYSVIVRTEDAGSLRDAGLRLNAAIGTIVTARWTRQEILKAASLESTIFIESDSDQNFPENQQIN